LVDERGCVVEFDVYFVLHKNIFGIVNFQKRKRIHRGQGGTFRSSDTRAEKKSTLRYILCSGTTIYDGGRSERSNAIFKIEIFETRLKEIK